MGKPSIEIVSAISEDGGMAANGDGRSLWNLPKDVRRFRDITSGSTHYALGKVNSMAIGSSTFNAMRRAGHPLFDSRFNIVVNDGEDAKVPFDHEKAKDFESAAQLAERRGSPRLFVVGNAQFYAEAFAKVDRLHLTIVRGTYETEDMFPGFPEIDGFRFTREYEENENNIDYTFQVYERKVS